MNNVRRKKNGIGKEKEGDAHIAAESKPRPLEQPVLYKAAQIKLETFKAKLARITNLPSIELVDEIGWQKFKEENADSSYRIMAIVHAEYWAQLMEFEMSKGKKLGDVAEATSHEAKIVELDDFMYEYAVSTLTHYWKYGEQLRCWCLQRWYRLKT